jgi:K+-transporting ATPase KdpF subunit
MDWSFDLGLAVFSALFVYLAYALMKPEKF